MQQCDVGGHNNKDQRRKVFAANATGNTFLIFDFLCQVDRNFDANAMRDFSSRFDDDIDSSLVLTRVSESSIQDSEACLRALEKNSEAIFLHMFVYESGDGFCGNGARAVCRYILENYPKFFSCGVFLLCNGYCHRLKCNNSTDDYAVEMGISDLNVTRARTYGFYSGIDLSYIDIKDIRFYFVFSSEPHLVTTEAISKEQLEEIGCIVNQDADYRKMFPVGVNVNRAQIHSKNQISVLTCAVQDQLAV